MIQETTTPNLITNFFTDPTAIIAMAALVLSLISLFSSIRHNRKSRNMTIEHNKLSVIPLFRISTEIVDNHYHIILSNVGSGAGIIKNLTYSFKDKEYSSLFDLLAFRRRELGYSKTLKGDDIIGHPSKGDVIGVGNSVPLFRASNGIENNLGAYNSFFRGIHIYIKYVDVYSNSYLVDENLIQI